MKSVLIVHHCDNDGYGAAAVIAHAVGINNVERCEMVGERLVVRVLRVVLFGIESAQKNQALGRKPHRDEPHQTEDSENEVIDTVF